MKAKITIRKMLFLVLSVIVLCSVIGLSASAVNYDCPHDLGETGWSTDPDVPCREIKWCDICGDYAAKPIQNSMLHNPGKWEEIVANTCQNPGLEAIFCTECEVYKFDERVIPAHDYETLFAQEATCMADGYKFKACLTCFDMVTEVLPKDPDAHNFTEWQITTEANCVNDSGVRTRYCLCFDENGNQCTKTETETYKDPDNHVENNWELDSTKVAPTCQAPGSLTKICEGCNEEIVKVLPQHSESSWEELSKVDSTCHTNGVQRRKCECGFEYDYILPLDESNHVYSEWITRKEPSCTAGKRYKYCKYHYNVEIEQEIPATGEHSFGEWITVIEPDCSKTGIEKQTCADCGKEVTRELPTKHDYTVWTVKAEMSCDESNLQDGSKLAKCNDCSFEKYFAIPALHDFGPWLIQEHSTCEAGNEGLLRRTCVGCGKVETKTYVEEHDFTAWYVTSKPVCAKDGKSGYEGQRTRWCRTCNYYEHESIGVNHEFTDWDIITYPTCTDSGKRTAKCNFCDEIRTEYPVAVGHEYGEVEIGTGTGADWKALTADKIICGKNVTEKSSCIYCGDVKYENKTVGHAYGNWYCDTKIDCSKDGIAAPGTFTRKCTRENCDTTQQNKQEDAVSYKHPNLKTVTTAATCTTSGYTIESCPDCGYSAIISEIEPAHGHKLDANWSSKIIPSCTAKGSRYKACANCDYLEYEEIAKTEHIHMYIELGVEPTCTQAGKSPKTYCAVCKEVFESVEIPALGHDYPEGAEVCTRCDAYKGSDKNCVCACHSQSGIEKIFFQLINKLYQMFGINQQCKCGDLHYTEPGFFAKLFGRG